MSKWTISDPGPAGGFSKEEHLAHLMFFVEPSAEEAQKFTGEGLQTVARCEWVVCTDCGLVLADQVMYGEALVPQLVNRGELVSGRLVTGKQRPGRSAPYVLEVSTDADRAKVEGFLEKYAVRMPSGSVVIEQPPTQDGEVF